MAAIGAQGELRMIQSTVCAALALCAIPALAQQASTPTAIEPADHPDWGEARRSAERKLLATLIDPGSATFEYVSGFQWGSTRLGLRKRRYGWVACGAINAKNRFGGYVGREPFFVFVDVHSRRVEIDYTWSRASTCDSGRYAPLQPELLAAPEGQPKLSIADELSKLADLRDKGIITPVEFDAAKSKLLAKPY